MICGIGEEIGAIEGGPVPEAQGADLSIGGAGDVFVEDAGEGEAGVVGADDAQALAAGVGVGRGDGAVGVEEADDGEEVGEGGRAGERGLEVAVADVVGAGCGRRGGIAWICCTACPPTI